MKRFKLMTTTVLALGLIAAHVADAKSKQPNPDEAFAEALRSIDCKGPKLRVAIYPFHATGKLAAFEGYNVGEGLAAQLATALQQTNCFVVLDRTGFSDVLREQEMALAGVVNQELAPAVGQVIPPQYVIKGTLTEFEPDKQGRGFTLGVAIPDMPFGLRGGHNGSTGHIAMDVSLIDASTGRMTAAHRVEADSKSGGWSVGLDFSKASVGTDSFGKTPLGQASRNALGQAAIAVLHDLSQSTWRSQVVTIEGNSIYLNAGESSGIKVGETFTVSTVLRELTDPASGVLIDRIEQDLGSIQIVSVDDRYAIARPLADFQVKRGDFVRM
jgi:curli biogenesis system outer membrane secretion channel CsgG